MLFSVLSYSLFSNVVSTGWGLVGARPIFVSTKPSFITPAGVWVAWVVCDGVAVWFMNITMMVIATTTMRAVMVIIQGKYDLLGLWFFVSLMVGFRLSYGIKFFCFVLF